MDFETLWRDGIGFWRVWVLTLGVRYRLFDRLDERAGGPVRLWRDAALALGLIGRRRGRLRPAILLDRNHADYLGGHLMYGALRSLDYESFGEFFRWGKTIDLLSRPRRNEAVQEATQWDHVVFLKKLPRTVRARLERGCDVLELGCGTGGWLDRMRREFPRSRFRGVDPDPETGAERGRAETYGRTASADLVYLGEVLHLTDRRRTLANCARVLRPGGLLLVLEGFLPEKVSTGKWESVLFAMQLDQALQGARFMKRSDLLPPKGLSKPRFVRLGGCVALAVFTKDA